MTISTTAIGPTPAGTSPLETDPSLFPRLVEAVDGAEALADRVGDSIDAMVEGQFGDAGTALRLQVEQEALSDLTLALSSLTENYAHQVTHVVQKIDAA